MKQKKLREKLKVVRSGCKKCVELALCPECQKKINEILKELEIFK